MTLRSLSVKGHRSLKTEGPTKKKTVSFQPNVQSATVLALDDYTNQELRDSWWSASEQKRISMRCFRVLDKMDSIRERIDEEKYCTRGLESHAGLASINKENCRHDATLSVLKEQERQNNNQLNDTHSADAIAEEYHKACSSSQMWAQVVGNRDQREAELYLYENEDEGLHIMIELQLQYSQKYTLYWPMSFRRQIKRN